MSDAPLTPEAEAVLNEALRKVSLLDEIEEHHAMEAVRVAYMQGYVEGTRANERNAA